MGKNGIKTDINGIEVEENKKIGGKNKKSGVGWVEKIKKICLRVAYRVPCREKGRGYMPPAARLPM